MILRTLNEVLPPPAGLDALARLDPLPSITGPSPNVAAPEPQIADARGVHLAGGSVVRVDGTACGLAIEGSGWVAAPDTVVTNAHVVAGESDTTVSIGGRSPRLPVRPIAFDPTDDIAVLDVPDLGLPALAWLASSPAGTAGAILGYPETGPSTFSRAASGEPRTAITRTPTGGARCRGC